MTETASFHLGDILTVATGHYCTPNGVEAIYELCAWMTGDCPSTHQLPRFSEECEPAIYEQHPDLREITVPKFTGPAEGMAWLGRMVKKYGEFRNLTPMPVVDHTRIDPIAELKMRKSDAAIITVDLGGGPQGTL